MIVEYSSLPIGMCYRLWRLVRSLLPDKSSQFNATKQEPNRLVDHDGMGEVYVSVFVHV
jgi:hypothetical protein